jgi:hypothetical protein
VRLGIRPNAERVEDESLRDNSAPLDAVSGWDSG